VKPAHFVGAFFPWVLFETRGLDARKKIGEGRRLKDAWEGAASRLPALENEQ
jgi:hypothetical protein